MANSIIPTKANLLATKKSLNLSHVGYELLNRKRNILVREMMQMIDHAEQIQNVIDDTYTEAYSALQMAISPWASVRSLPKPYPLTTGFPSTTAA